MVGLYIHIPFCRRKCGYCTFASAAGREEAMAAYVGAVVREAEVYRGETADTVFLGGGTPSLLPPALLGRLLEGVNKSIAFTPGAEVSLEANPESTDAAAARAWRALGVTRVSLGLQAVQDELLRAIGRVHTCADFLAALRAVEAAGVAHINADLMYALPGQTVRQAEESARAVCALGIDHLSAYALTLEEGAPLFGCPQPDEETDRAMFHAIEAVAEKAGFARYEISNFARPGGQCRHNLKYWRVEDYVGLGAAAHSCCGGERYGNLSDLDEYIGAIRTGACARAFTQRRTPADCAEEAVMLKTRLCEGMQRGELPATPRMEACLARLEEGGMLVQSGGRVALTGAGMDVQNSVVVELALALEGD